MENGTPKNPDQHEKRRSIFAFLDARDSSTELPEPDLSSKSKSKLNLPEKKEQIQAKRSKQKLKQPFLRAAIRKHFPPPPRNVIDLDKFFRKRNSTDDEHSSTTFLGKVGKLVKPGEKIMGGKANTPVSHPTSQESLFPVENVEKDFQNTLLDSFKGIVDMGNEPDPWKYNEQNADIKPAAQSIYKNNLAAPASKRQKGSTVTFNVGGQKYMTLLSSISKHHHPDLKLKDPEFMVNHWDNEREEYFFDRDPTAFSVILNYLRTGKLHLPQAMCSPQVTEELIYWGLRGCSIEACCWKDYSIGIQQIENLGKLERERQPCYLRKDLDDLGPQADGDSGLCTSCTRSVWETITDVGSTRKAKVYAVVSLIGISVSLGSFIIETVYSEECEKAKKKGYSYETWPTKCIILLWTDLACFAFFLMDILLHFVYCPKLCEYLKSLGFYIDTLALMPDAANVVKYLNQDVSMNELAIELFSIMTLLRVVRLFRFMRRLTGVMIVIYSLWKSIKELVVLLTILCVTTVVFASFVTLAEERADPGTTNLTNFADGVWYSMITLTTVGYGDIVPVTVFGKIIGAVCAVWGVLILGITIPTMVTNFSQYHVMMSYIKERESIFLFHRYSNHQQIPNIPFPEFL